MATFIFLRLNCIVLTYLSYDPTFGNIQHHDRLISVCLPEEKKFGTEIIYSSGTFKSDRTAFEAVTQ